jgi:hypothetical protein
MMQIAFAEKNRLAFLWGQHQSGGWWWYFPFAFAIKTPIPLIIGLVTVLILVLRGGWQRLREELVLWFFPLVYVVTAIPSGLNIGYRHLMPAFPFAYVSIGRLGPALFQMHKSRWRHIARLAAVALGVWYVVGTLQVYPFALAYFNEFVGGPRNGYRYLVDSNLDWGQSFKALKTFMDTASIKKVWLSYFTYVDPAVYGVRYEPLYPAPDTAPIMPGRFDPAPGIYAISATTLQGIMQFPDLYDWFRHQEPTAQPGYGLLVYQVTPHDRRGRWVAQCNVPQVPMNTQIIEEGFNRDDLRQIVFDCTTSWIYPEGGQSPGWYGLHREAWLSRDSFLRQHLTARLTYQQTWYYDEPPFALSQWQGTEALPAWANNPIRTAPWDWSPPRVEAEGSVSTVPVRLNGLLTFLGYRVSSSDKTLELETAWRAEATPKHSLSLMARVVGADGSVFATADGLGVPVDQWRAGDILVQRHRLTLPEGTQGGNYWLQTGVLDLVTHQRLMLPNGNDQLLLGGINAR